MQKNSDLKKANEQPAVTAQAIKKMIYAGRASATLRLGSQSKGMVANAQTHGALPQKLVLHADDDENVRVLLEYCLSHSDLPLKYQSVTDGKQALHYLSGIGRFQDRTRYPLPDVLVLDLDMPGLDGFDVLKWIRARHPSLNVPVIILSASESQQDSERAAKLGANAYLMKDSDGSSLINELSRLWSH